jgi:prephenate dehydratase
MFFVDLEGRDTEHHVAGALDGLRGHVEALRVLGSFPVA